MPCHAFESMLSDSHSVSTIGQGLLLAISSGSCFSKAEHPHRRAGRALVLAQLCCTGLADCEVDAGAWEMLANLSTEACGSVLRLLRGNTAKGRVGNKAPGVRRRSWVPSRGQTSGFRWARRGTPSDVEVCLFCGPVVLYFALILNMRHGVEPAYGCYQMCLRREQY